MKRNGFTLIELLVVIAIIGILTGLAAPGFMNFVTKNRIENQTKRMYADLMNTRVMAMNRNMTHFVVFKFNSVTNEYAVVADTSGNRSYDAPPGDTQVLKRGAADIQPFTFTNQLVQNNLIDDNFTNDRVAMNARGVADNLGTVCIGKAFNVRHIYNCIVVNPTQIRMGRLNAVGADCNATNCE